MNTLPFSRSLNIATRTIADKLFPAGFDVGPDAPETLTELVGLIEQTGRMKVSDAHCENTIFSCPETNMAFRAWHDWCHWRGRFAFTLEGEYQAFEMQVSHLHQLGLWSEELEQLMFAEVVGQAIYFEATGEFPSDQRAFTRHALKELGQSIAGYPSAYADFMRTGKSSTYFLSTAPSMHTPRALAA